MANREFKQFLYGLHNYPVLIDCDFVVQNDAAEGISELNSDLGGVSDVYMHTSAPVSGEQNPAAGVIFVQMDSNYNGIYNVMANIEGPLDSVINVTASSMTAGDVYVVKALGTTTAAAWAALGVPENIDLAVGVPFIATATFSSGTGTVQLVKPSGITNIEVSVGSDVSVGGNQSQLGGYLILQCMKNGVLTAPANGSRVMLSIYLSNSDSRG